MHQYPGGDRVAKRIARNFVRAARLLLLRLEPFRIGLDGGDDVEQDAIRIGGNEVALAEDLIAQRLDDGQASGSQARAA